MPEVKGFRGYRFDSQVAGPYDDVITPPYDVINPSQRAELMARSPHNMVHVLLPEGAGDERYQNAANHLDSWIAKGVMKQDPEPSLYVLSQTFKGLDGEELVRKAFFAVARLPEYGKSSFLDHERVFEKKVTDRLTLTEHTRANLGAVFVMYRDPENELSPLYDVANGRTEDMRAITIDGVTQRLWRIPHDNAVTRFLRDQVLYIADGHHRFRTACLYRDRMHEREQPEGERPYDYILMGFVAMEDPGLRVWPTHRLADPPEGFNETAFLEAAGQWFDINPAGDDLAAQVEQAPGCALGMAVHGGGRYLMTLRDIDRSAFLGDDRTEAWRDLDVAVLHRGIFERIMGMPEGAEYVYEPKADAALETVVSGEKGLGFFLKGTRTDQICACAHAADPMPQKSTYFYPKLPSGAVIHRLV